jgi:hypothetical protein
MSQQHDLTNDPFFRLIDESEWNACIGPQGHEENYVDGYIEAALFLAETVLEKKLHDSRDTLVLPILYNARHAIELTLKFVVRRLHAVGLYREVPRANHKIHKYLENLQMAKIGDYEFRENISKLSPFVQSLAEVDDDGQQLRYATDQTGKSSLENRPLANILVIRTSLQELRDILRFVKRRTQSLCEEHDTGTYTPLCSRSDLMAIAHRLKAHPERRGASYEKVRAEIKARYELGNKTLDQAISIIEVNREMGSILGREFDLKYLSDDRVRYVVACWTKLHPKRAVDEARVRSVSAADLMRYIHSGPNTGQIVKEIIDHLTLEELVDLDTVFYLARDRHFPEAYEALYEQTNREYAASNDQFENVSHLLGKTNLLKELSRGLALLGRRRLAAEVWATRPDLH